MLKDYYYY